MVKVDKKLNVTGTEDYEYVLISSQYKNWKSSYFPTLFFAIVIAELVIWSLIFLSFDEGFKWYALLPVPVAMFVFGFLIRSLLLEFKTSKQLRKIDFDPENEH